MQNNKKWSPKFLLISLLVLVLATFGAWAVSSRFGHTKIQRVNVLAQDGKSMSYVMFVPETATDETPAPAFVIWPGRSSNAHQLDMWALEMSREGYVAMTVDWNGNGESDILNGQEAYVAAVMDHIMEMPFVDPDQLIVLGNSAGNGAAQTACAMYEDHIITYINDVHPMLVGNQPNANTLLIQANADQYVRTFVGSQDKVVEKLTADWGLSESVEERKFYGNAADRTLRQFVVTPTIHQISALNGKGMTAAKEYLTHTVKGREGTPVTPNVFGWCQLFQCIAYAGIIMFVLSFGNALYELVPFFHEIGNAPTANKGLRGAALKKNIAVSVLIPLITFFPVSWAFHNAEFLSPIFRSRNLRGIIGWLVTNAVITLIMTLISANKAKKEGHPMQASDFGFAGEGEKFQPYKLGRALILAAIVVTIVFAWVSAVESLTGLNYQIWNVLNISRIPANRALACIPFTLCVFVIMFASNIGMNTTRRLEETDNPKADMTKQVVLNVLVAAGVITFLLLVQYGGGWITGKYIMPQLENFGGGTSSGSLDFSFGFPLIMGFSSGMSTYFYKKTNNIWIGLCISAILAGIIGVVGATFVTGQAVM